jgi:Protein of unknown function (DUF2857)
MPKTTHAELVFHTLRYVTETLAEGDLHAVLDLGFRVDQVARLERLTLRELQALSQVRTHFLDVSIDSACFDRVLDHMERNKDQEALQDGLIRLRAPLAMMRAFFGVTNAEYAARRKLLGLAGTGVGRPPAPSEEDEQRVWQAWQAQAHLAVEQRYLQVGQTTGVPLNTVWALIRSWEAAELLTDKASNEQDNVISLRRGVR